MSRTPQISVIIPIFNGSKFIKETVNSVLDQLFEDFELLIINDGSTDDTDEIALSLQRQESRIVYYKKSNSGVSASRNFGLEKARGEFVVFLDADDLMQQDFLQSRVNYLETHPDVGVCGSAVRFIDEYGQLKLEIGYAPGEHMQEDILYYKPGITTVPSNLMCRKSLLTDHGINFDSRLNSSADKLFLCKLALVTKSYCLPEANFYYRIHANSMYHDPNSSTAIFRDNELFIQILRQEGIVPENRRNTFLVKNYYMLAGAAWKVKLYSLVMQYGLKYFLARAKLY